MAYRTFENQSLYEAPEVNILPKTMALLQTYAVNRQRQQQQNRQLAANFQADKLDSKFTKDQDEFNQLSHDITQRAVQSIYNRGTVDPATKIMMNQAKGLKAQSDAQWTMKEDLEKRINDNALRDKYYDPTHDQEMLVQAAYGKPEENVNFVNRGERLNAIGNTIGTNKLQSFKKEQYLQDWVKDYGKSTQGNTFRDAAGNETGKKNTAYFFDENKVPRVTDDHAKEYLSSNENLQEYYRQAVDQKLLEDAKKMAATKEGAWVKNLNEHDIVQAFRDNPSLDTETKLLPGQMELGMAKKDLEKMNRVSVDNSYKSASLDDQNKSRNAARGITSLKYDAIPVDYNDQTFGGTGFQFVNKDTGTNGITFKITGPVWNKNDNRLEGSRDAERPVQITSATLGLTDSKNRPVDIKAKSVADQIKYMENLSPIEFHKLKLSVLAHGQSVNQLNLSYATKQRDQLRLKAGKTPEEQNQLETLENTLNELRVNPELALEIIQKNLGVKVDDVVFPIEPGSSDEANIAGKLGNGQFKITNPSKWSPEMKEMRDAYLRIKKEKEPQYEEQIKTKSANYEQNVKDIKGGTVKQSKTPEVPAGRVIVQDKDGNQYHIPESQVPEAEKQGYTRVKK